MFNKILLLCVLFFLLTVSFIFVIKSDAVVGITTSTEKGPRVANLISTQAQVCKTYEELEYFSYDTTLWDKNNKFGLYVYAESANFFEIAQELVNSNGGDWGYVLIPFNVKDTDYDKWERVFEQLRNKHLIPVIQLWDIDTDEYEEQTMAAAKFLNSFIWPIQERYVSAYNEMNSASFWYGYVDAKEYARILDFTIDFFKSVNSNFFMLNGAFNTSAPTDADHLDALAYMYEMDQEVDGIFDKLDGWASHSYPQPNFTGSPYAEGRWSIRAYADELEYLEDILEVEKELPVFITETGWAHAEGNTYNPVYLNAEQVAENFEIAFEEVWLQDGRVRAVMPFTIKYDAPFDHFSWINPDNVAYKQYDVVKAIPKVAGNPPQLVSQKVKVSGCYD